MQQTGTLRKRKKRNIAKVAGLAQANYNEFEDNFDGKALFTSTIEERDPFPLSYRTESDTRLRMSALMHQNQSGSIKKRVTRDPKFHLEEEDEYPTDFNTDRHSSVYSGSIDYKSPEFYKNQRSHFLDKATMNRLRQLLILGASAGAFPWKWNNKEKRIDKWSPFMERVWKVQWFFVTIQTTFLTGFQFYSFFNRVSGSNKTYREVFMNSLSVYWYICAVYFNINMFIYKDQIRQYINTLLNFNKEYVQKYLIHTEGYKDGGRILINLSIPSNCSQVFASVALFCVMPYQPWYIFSYIYPKPWYWLIPGALQEYTVVGQVITSYMLTSWIVVAHTLSVDFWLRETHNHNESDYTSDELRLPKTAIETYRALQILCTCFNDCMSPLAIPLVKIHILTGLIPCGYVLIRSMNQIFIDEFPGILTYPIGVIDCATAGFA
ncbi:unnamed protein product [Orchesella dallaii]|uniref:Gustatory receptor n=1 Tax=Orchesella dallaii TaxID=48710 RepID=A0ABP1RZW0_9HEXA